jgi:hypothetical protein
MILRNRVILTGSLRSVPNVETMGYSQVSLQDKGGQWNLLKGEAERTVMVERGA